MTASNNDPKPVAAPAQSELDKQLADGNFAADQVLTDNAVAQGAVVEGRKDSEQNKGQAEKNRVTLAEEAEEAGKEREKLREQLRKDREKAEKNS